MNPSGKAMQTQKLWQIVWTMWKLVWVFFNPKKRTALLKTLKGAKKNLKNLVEQEGRRTGFFHDIEKARYLFCLSLKNYFKAHKSTLAGYINYLFSSGWKFVSHALFGSVLFLSLYLMFHQIPPVIFMFGGLLTGLGLIVLRIEFTGREMFCGFCASVGFGFLARMALADLPPLFQVLLLALFLVLSLSLVFSFMFSILWGIQPPALITEGGRQIGKLRSNLKNTKVLTPVDKFLTSVKTDYQQMLGEMKKTPSEEIRRMRQSLDELKNLVKS